MNYVLIGLPGSGKSTLGVLLAKYMGLSFLDSDIVIQETTGKLLRQIIEEEGPEGFIEIENRIGCGICTENTVIATGGSAVLGREAMEHYRRIGRIVYLQMSFEEMTKRICGGSEPGRASGGETGIRDETGVRGETGTRGEAEVGSETGGRDSTRLRNRGVVLREGQTLREMYEERCNLYTTYADVTIAEEQMSMGGTLQKILEILI